MSIKDLLAKAAEISNQVIGEVGTYTRKDGAIINDVHIILDESAEIQTEFGAIGGYDIEAILLKSEIAFVDRLDKFNFEGKNYRINLIKRESTAKYYCSVVKL